MVKRIVAAGLLLVALVLVTTQAHAEAYGYRSAGFLTFRTHKAALGPGVSGYSGTDASGGYADSVGFYGGNAADTQDTSAVLKLPNDMCMPQASDSLPVIALVFRAQASPSDATPVTFGSGDTLYYGLQPSVGGSFLTHTAYPTVAFLGIAGANGFGVAEAYKAAPSGSNAGSQTAPRAVAFVPGLGVTKAFRLLTYSDGTSAFTGVGWVTVEVLYPQCR